MKPEDFAALRTKRIARERQEELNQIHTNHARIHSELHKQGFTEADGWRYICPTESNQPTILYHQDQPMLELMLQIKRDTILAYTRNLWKIGDDGIPIDNLSSEEIYEIAFS